MELTARRFYVEDIWNLISSAGTLYSKAKDAPPLRKLKGDRD